MKIFRAILIAHAVYILITALWSIIDIESFMRVTGPKTDVWLVKTVGALLIPVAICMISSIETPNRLPVSVLGAGIALSFIVIDLYYALSDVISDIYLADAFLEFLFLLGWIYVLGTYPRKQSSDV
jgi:hypothetical protein